MQSTVPGWVVLIKDICTLSIVPLAAAFIGAKYGATKAHEIAAAAKAGDEDRRRGAVASALLWEIESIAQTLEGVLQWEEQGYRGNSGTPMLDQYFGHIELFDAPTTTALLSIKDAFFLMMTMLSGHSELRRPETREHNKQTVKRMAKQVLSDIPSVRQRLLASGATAIATLPAQQARYTPPE